MLRDLEKQSIQVTVRVRPLSEKQLHQDSRCCIKPDGGSQRLTLLNGNQSKTFAFDSVAGAEEGQGDIFQKVGLNSTAHCLEGYNCSIFAYGQTGSGKTFTMMGVGQEDPKAFEKRGLVPRTLQHLFQQIDRETQESRTEYLIKCTFVQIYNQTIIDLLDKNNSNLQIREDLKKGVYLQGVLEETISKAEEALDLLRRGSKGRHVGSTYYNQTSSRSHSVFTLLLQSKFTKNGVVNVKARRFHFIDLAGSQRTRHSNGERLKQGCSINKSLHVLGMVINSLVQATQGKTKHVNYRDSKLTFLLKDALGGNSKTHLIANISPGQVAYPQTLSTLNFARRVKLIKVNKALINQDASGNLQALKSQILRLKQEIIVLKSHPTTSLIANVKQTTGQEPISSQLQRVFLKSDGHLGLQKLLQDYIQQSIQKQTKFQVQLLKREQKIGKLYQALKQYGKNQIHLRMIVQIYEKRFQRMKDLQIKLQSLGSIDSQQLNVFFQQQKLSLNIEVSQLRELLKETPFLKALIKQNTILRQQTRNPQELAGIIGANMKFLTQLKESLGNGIKQRQDLNNIIQHYAMLKNINTNTNSNEIQILSPRKQKQMEDDLKAREQEHKNSIQQLGLEIAFLKATSQQNELLLKESIQREMELEDKIVILDEKVAEGEGLKEKLSNVEKCLWEAKERQKELEERLQNITFDLIASKEQIQEKQQLVREERKINIQLRQQNDNTTQSFSDLTSQFQKKIESLQKQLSLKENQYQSLTKSFQSSQLTFLSQKQFKDKTIQSKSKQLTISHQRISSLQSQLQSSSQSLNLLKLQLSSSNQLHSKKSSQLQLTIQKLSNQIQNQRLQNKKRQQQLQNRWNEKVLNEDQGKKKIKELNLQLISKESKFMEVKNGLEKIIEENNKEILKLSSSIQILQKEEEENKNVIENYKAKEGELVERINKQKEEVKRLEISMAYKQQVYNETREELKKKGLELENKVKELSGVVKTLEEKEERLEEIIERKQKQIQRGKENHSQEIQMMKEEGVEYRKRMALHEQSMKEIFDECLKNKDKLIGELKEQQSDQIEQHKCRLEQIKIQAKQAQTKIKELQVEIQTLLISAQTKDIQIQKLKDDLSRQIEQSQRKQQERQNDHNQFIDRKNQQIEQMQMQAQQLIAKLMKNEQILLTKQNELKQVEELLVGQKSKIQGLESLRDRMKGKLQEQQRCNEQLKRANLQLSTQLIQSNIKESSQTQQITLQQQELQQLKQQLKQTTQLSQQLIRSNLQHTHTLQSTKGINQSTNLILSQKQTQIQSLSQQLLSLQQTIQLKTSQSQTMKQRVSDLKSQILQSFNQTNKIQQMYNTKILSYKQSLLQKDQMIKTSTSQLSQHKLLIQNLKSQNQQISNKMEILLKDNKILNQNQQKLVLRLKQENDQKSQINRRLQKVMVENQELKGDMEDIIKQSKEIENQKQNEKEVLRIKVEEMKIQVKSKQEQMKIKQVEIEELNKKLTEIRICIAKEKQLKRKSEMERQNEVNQKNQKIRDEQEERILELEEKIKEIEILNEMVEQRNEEQQKRYKNEIKMLKQANQELEKQVEEQRELGKEWIIERELFETERKEQKIEKEKVNEEKVRELDNERALWKEKNDVLNNQLAELLESQNKLQEKSSKLSEENYKLTLTNEELKISVNSVNEDIQKESEKNIGLKRLIENLQRQKQQLQMQLQEKQTSYKRLLSKICKQDEPKKVSQDKKTILKTNELLQKSRIELLEYKKAAEQNVRQVKRLKAQMQTKQDHYIAVHQKAQEYCKSQQIKLSQINANYQNLQEKHSSLLIEMKSMQEAIQQVKSLRSEVQVHKSYKERSQRRREDLQLTIKSLSEQLQKIRKQCDEKIGFNRGQDQKIIFINKLKEQNGLIKREKFTLTEETARLKRQNQILLSKLTDESEEKLRLKQLYDRKTLKESGQRDASSHQVASKIELQRKQAQIRYLQEGYAELCTILNIKKLSQPKNRGESTLGMIKSVVQSLTQQVSVLRGALKQRQRQIQFRNNKLQTMTKDYNHFKSKDYKRMSANEYNPLKNALQQTNKIVGDEYNSFQNLKNRALQLKEQSKLKRQKY